MTSTPSFEVCPVIQIMRRFNFLFRDGDAQFGCDGRDHFDGLIEIVQHVCPEMKTPSDTGASSCARALVGAIAARARSDGIQILDVMTSSFRVDPGTLAPFRTARPF